MRTQGYVYVDKTTHVARLAEEGKYYLLARTRRFGKGLLVDTLAEAFAGRGGGLERGTAPPKWECSATGPGIWATTAAAPGTGGALIAATSAASTKPATGPSLGSGNS
jgi:hypothetical protein